MSLSGVTKAELGGLRRAAPSTPPVSRLGWLFAEGAALHASRKQARLAFFAEGAALHASCVLPVDTLDHIVGERKRTGEGW